MLFEVLVAAAMLQDRAPDPVCRPDVRWVADTTRALTRTGPARQVSVLSVAAAGPCGSVRLTVTATFLDQAGDVVCWGTVPNVSVHAAGVTFLHVLEVKVGNLLEFVRWRNAGRVPRQAVPLTCHASDGVGEVPGDGLDAARTVRLLATATTTVGYEGHASDEVIFAIAP